MLTTPDIPKIMKAVQGKDFGEIEAMLSVEKDVPVPRLADLAAKERATSMLIRTHAVALAPGDIRVLSGRTREMQGPPSFPYIPGGDCCGTVVELPMNAKDLPFSIGDRVAARFVDGPRGALGEYAIVSTRVADLVPESLASEEAAALVSASPAMSLAELVSKGERVLVLGAAGGVGSHLCQILRARSVSFLVGVSDSPMHVMAPPISCDAAVDYTKEDIFAQVEFQVNPFDTIIDLASNGWPRLLQSANIKHSLIVKPAVAGGRFLTLTPDQHSFDCHSLWQLLQLFVFPTLWRAFVTRTWYRSRLPAYKYVLALPDNNEGLRKTFELNKANQLSAILHNNNPFPFTTQGVREAFRVQESRHTKGKVVVHVADADVS
jgi:NADPH:quinone reductase-like Zn-dependent oxidoreductase